MADLSSIANELTIASNAIFLAFTVANFQPTVYTVEDYLVAEDRAGEINAIEGPVKIFPTDLTYVLTPSAQTIFVPFRRDYARFPRFSYDLGRGAYFGGTVTYWNLQVAFHLGCHEVILIGVDHSYRVPGGVNGDVITSGAADVNHFDPSYFGPGFRWHDPKVDRMELAYREARVAFERHGRRIRNATRGGSLEVFERVDLDRVLRRP